MLKVHVSTIRKTLKKNCLGGECLISVKRTWLHSFRLQNCILTKKKFFKKVLWKEKTKVETLGHTAHHHGKKQKQHISPNT